MTSTDPMTTETASLIGLNRAQMQAEALRMGEPAFRGTQLYKWVYNRGVSSFDAMTDMSKAFRARLTETASLERPAVAADQLSEDGTRKWLLRFRDGSLAETVFIPNGPRGTLCVSSQVGCSLTCSFCHTGTQRLARNLTAGEILAQLMHARDALSDWALHEGDRRITNIVMMGMGEPLYNADNVIHALQLMTDGDGIAISRRRVMLSTAGVVPEIPRAGRETGVRLAVSLHAVTDELRNILVPVNRKYPLEQLLRAVREWPDLGGAGGRVTWEYVMLRDVNDSEADARALISLIRGIPSKVNLIPFNPWPGSPYERSRPEVIQRFADILWNAGYSSPVRTPRGQDILAACGQLKTATLRQPRRGMVPVEAATLSS